LTPVLPPEGLLEVAPSIVSQPRAKPFLRWAGSKRKQLGRLSSFWSPSHARYVEPFAGSACLFFELAPQAAVLGDNNSSLIELYRVVRDQPENIFRRLCRIGRDSDTYYRWRDLKPAKLDRETRAVRFIYLNRNCFNGIFRTNVKGEFNVPIGVRTGVYISKDDLLLCARLLERATLVAGDFEKTLKHVQAGDFVYLDPPFALESRRVFRHYGNRSFQTTDVPRLGDALRRITAAGADFLVSYADCTEARGLAREWTSIRLPIPRHIGGNDRRRHAYEWLITNMKLPDFD
jgi:DNA adenine methylase